MVIRSADGAALSASILQFTISYTQPDHPVYTINASREAVRAINLRFSRGLHWRDCCPAAGVTGKTPTAAIES